MKSIVVVLVCLALAISGPVRGAEEEEKGIEIRIFPLVIFSDMMKEHASKLWDQRFGSGGENWKECGDYFATNETLGPKIVRFAFQRFPLSSGLVQIVFSTLNIIVVSVDERAVMPIVIVLGDGPFVILQMNSENYTAILPCLSRGVGT